MDLSECSPHIGEDGNLCFAYPGARTLRGEIGPWSSGWETHTIRNGHGILSYFWSLDLLSDDVHDSLSGPVAAFIEEIPAGVRECVRAYRFGQCFMLRHAAAHREVADLLRSNPNLYWLLARAVYDSRIDQEHIAGLCRRKQLEILKRLIPSATKATLRLLARIEPEFGALFEARVITTVLSRSRTVAATAHQPMVPYRLLEVLERHSRLAESSLVTLILRELESGDRSSRELGNHVDEVLDDIARMVSTLRIDRPDRTIARCETTADLDRLHDRWAERMNRKLPAFLRPEFRHQFRIDTEPDPLQLGFPPPPFPDSADIEAIRTVEDLVLEGQQQAHCVASYAQDVAAGKVYIYRVLQPSRATVELRKTEDGWEVGQFKLARNRAPGIQARLCVRDWLVQAGRNELPQPIVI